jgi:hypothetical protein|tara:strand:+ start:720 stop:902 length:183 start_codon:yes stop_codon:yes gene_type:complete
MKELENNKYYKYITTIGERAVVYNNRIDNEIDLFSNLSKSERKMIKKIFLKLINELDRIK